MTHVFHHSEKLRHLLVGLLLSLVTMTISCSDDPAEADCTPGDEGCECSASDRCFPGLQCLSGICVEDGTGLDGGVEDAQMESCELGPPTCVSPQARRFCSGGQIIQEICATDQTCRGGRCVALADVTDAGADSAMEMGNDAGMQMDAGNDAGGPMCLAGQIYCGGDCISCVPPANGSASCGMSGACEFVCDSGYEACNDKCCVETVEQSLDLVSFRNRVGFFAEVRLDSNQSPHVMSVDEFGSLDHLTRDGTGRWTREFVDAGVIELIDVAFDSSDSLYAYYETFNGYRFSYWSASDGWKTIGYLTNVPRYHFLVAGADKVVLEIRAYQPTNGSGFWEFQTGAFSETSSDEFYLPTSSNLSPFLYSLSIRDIVYDGQDYWLFMSGRRSSSSLAPQNLMIGKWNPLDAMPSQPESLVQADGLNIRTAPSTGVGGSIWATAVLFEYNPSLTRAVTLDNATGVWRESTFGSCDACFGSPVDFNGTMVMPKLTSATRDTWDLVFLEYRNARWMQRGGLVSAEVPGDTILSSTIAPDGTFHLTVGQGSSGNYDVTYISGRVPDP